MSGRFAMVPRRVYDLFRKGEMSADVCWLLIVLVLEADHTTHEAVFPNLRSLKSVLGWDRGKTRSEQHVSNCLDAARDLGEISHNLSQGQRGPIVVSILSDDYFQAKKASVLEATSNGATADDTNGNHPARAAVGRLPTLEVDASQTRPDVDLDEDAHQNRGDGAALVEESLNDRNSAATARAAQLVSLLESGVEGNTEGVIARYVRQMPAHEVDEAEASFRSAVARGEVRNEAKYLVGTLKKRAERAVGALP